MRVASVLSRSCVGSHSCCEFRSPTVFALMRSEDNFSLSSDPQHLQRLLHDAPWALGDWCDTNVLFIAKCSKDTSFLNFDQLWVFILISCNSKLLWWVKTAPINQCKDEYLDISLLLWSFSKITAVSSPPEHMSSLVMGFWPGLSYQIWVLCCAAGFRSNQKAVAYSIHPWLPLHARCILPG